MTIKDYIETIKNYYTQFIVCQTFAKYGILEVVALCGLWVRSLDECVCVCVCVPVPVPAFNQRCQSPAN